MKEYCFLNGEIIKLEEAKVGVMDIGLLRGYGIYDGLLLVNGKVFHLEEHWDRFLSGAHFLNLNVPITLETARKKMEELAIKNGFVDRANIRMIVTGGKTIAGIEYQFEHPTFFITVEKFTPLPDELYKSGAKLITTGYMREFPEYKTINYIRGVSLQEYRKEEGAIEILYTHEGEVYECATSNVFLFIDGVLVTPSENILGGITRKVVLGLAKDKYKIEERRVHIDELKEASEIFITSSFKDIVPVTKIDDFEVGDGQVGQVTKDLMQMYSLEIQK